jgi:hypothetical protein
MPATPTSNVTSSSITDNMQKNQTIPNEVMFDQLKDLSDGEYPLMCYLRLVIMLGQFMFYIGITILIDHIRIHGFRGKDFKAETVERNQMEEKDDVLHHKNETI